MKYEIEIREVEAQKLAAVRGIAKGGDLVPKLRGQLDKVWKFLRANSQVGHEGLNVFLYYGEAGEDLLNSQGGLPVASGVKVKANFPDAGEVACLSTPAGRVATTIHIGPYSKLPAAHAAVRRWCVENGQALTGVNWELYDHWKGDEATARTDVFYLLGGS